MKDATKNVNTTWQWKSVLKAKGRRTLRQVRRWERLTTMVAMVVVVIGNRSTVTARRHLVSHPDHLTRTVMDRTTGHLVLIVSSMAAGNTCHTSQFIIRLWCMVKNNYISVENKISNSISLNNTHQCEFARYRVLNLNKSFILGFASSLFSTVLPIQLLSN